MSYVAYPPTSSTFEETYLSPNEDIWSSGYSDEAKTVKNQFRVFVIHQVTPISRQQSTILRFFDLAATWQEETRFASTVLEVVVHPAYQEIIGMGTKVIPLILREVQADPDHWFWALRAITGEDPVDSSKRGNVSEMIDAWVSWGKDNAYIR